MLLPPTLTDLHDQLSTIRHLNMVLCLAAGSSSDGEIDALGSLAGVIREKLIDAIATLDDIRQQGQQPPGSGR